MKKIIISIIVLLGIMMPRITMAQNTDPEPYAVLSEGNTVLTFYYDKQKETRSGMDLTYTPWRADETKGTITKVVFDASFADCTTLTTTDSWFNECSSLVTIENISNLKTENVTNMSAMFRNCTSLTSIDFESFNTSRATTLDNMFFGCTGLTSLDLSSFNTARVEDMHSMFAGCNQLTTLDLSHFDTSSLTNIQGMFSGCEKLDTVDLSSWKPTQVTDIRYMFYYCTNLTTVYVGPKWNLSSVTDNGTDVFTNCINIVGGKGTKYSTLYTDYTYAHIDRGTSYPGYFRGHPEPYVDYDNTVLTFYYDDQKDYHDGLSIVPFGKNPPLWSEYCYNGIKTVVFDDSFANCTTLTSTSNWFYNCNKLTTIKNIQNLKTDNVEDMQMMFWRCSSLTNIDLSNFNTENVTNMRSMFEGCTMLESIDVSGFNTGKVTDMHAMFYQCSSLKRINASNFNTENVTTIQSMFGECTNLRSIDISSFKTDKVTNMIGAFYESPNLTTIYVGNGWSTASVTDSQNMFLNCTSIKGGAGTTYDENHIDKEYAHIDAGAANPGYLTDIVEPYAVLTDNDDEITTDEGTTVKGKTLTFYYDTQKADREGMDVGPFSADASRKWHGQRTNITEVVFDDSFASCSTLTSTAQWFRSLKNLKSIKNIANLKTDNVTDMYGMFYGCSSLTSIDLSGFNTRNVTDMTVLFTDCSSLTSLDLGSLTTDNVTNMSFMFSGCFGITSLDLSGFNTEKVTIMWSMFDGCTGLTSLNVSNFNTTNVTNMSQMFKYCSNLTSIDVSGFNTENVTNMASMFYGCSKLTSLNLYSIKTNNVESMHQMFSGCSSISSLDISNFKTDSVKNMKYMFDNCSHLTSLDLTSFNTANVTDMYGMFSGCSGLTTIYVDNNWSTEAVTESSNMFIGCNSLVGGAGTVYDESHVDASYAHIDGGKSNPGYFTDIADKDKKEPEPYAVLTDNDDYVTTIVGDTVKGKTLTFYYDTNRGEDGMNIGPFHSKLSSPWDSENMSITKVVFDDSFANYNNLTSTYGWFSGCYNLSNITGIANLKTDSVTNMNIMFAGCSSLTSLDVSGFNTAKVKNIGFMFYKCSSLKSLDVSGFNTENVTDMSGMFEGCSSLTSLDVSGFNTAKVTEMYDMFEDCSSLTSLDVSGFNTANVTGMYHMFDGCSGLTSLDVSSFNTANVTYMSYMFGECSSLTHLDLSNFNTAKVTDMERMFISCSNLKTLDMSGFNIANVERMSEIFHKCSNLTTIYASSEWNAENVKYDSDMFTACFALIGGAGTAYDNNHTEKEYAHIDGGVDNPGYFTDIADKDKKKKVATPKWSFPDDRDYLSVTTDTEGASIYYAIAKWTDESKTDSITKALNVSVDSTLYTNYISIESNVVVKMIATKDGMEDSDTATFVYNHYAWLKLHDILEYGKETYGEAKDNEKVDQDLLSILESLLEDGSIVYPMRAIEKDSIAKSLTYQIGDICAAIYEQLNAGDDQTDNFTNRKLVLWRQVGGKEYRLYKWVDMDNIRVNADGWKMYRTRLTLDIIHGTDTMTTVVDDGTIYAEQSLYSESMTQCMMIDVDNNKMYVFANSKTDKKDYTMDGYAYVSPIDQPAFTKEIVFSTKNWGWFSYFKGVENGQPVLSHFSYAGYYDELSKRNADGTWTTTSDGSSSQDGSKNRFLEKRRLNVVGDNDSDEVTIDGVVYTIRNEKTAWVIWLENNTTIKSLTIPKTISVGEKTLTVNGLAPYSFFSPLKLTALDLPSTIETFGESSMVKCSKLTSLTVRCTTPPTMTLDDRVLTQFTNADTLNCILYVPNRTVSLYKNADGWSMFKNIAVIDSEAEQVDTPKIQFEDNKLLLTSETEDATIYYTIKPFDNIWDTDTIKVLADQLVVDDSSSVYQDYIDAHDDFIIKAVAVKEGMMDSEPITYIYPFTEWQYLIATTYAVMARIEDATRNYTPSDELKAKIEQLMVEIDYVHKVYNNDRTEWERDRIRAERALLDEYCYELEIQIKEEQSERITATYDHYVLSVRGQTTMAQALEQVGSREEVAKSIAAIVWNSTEPITRSDIEGFGNPNLLIYVQTDSMAPEGINNVIIDGKAKNIVLADADGNNNFYVPQEFTAENIIYSRIFKQTTQDGISRGWEGIALPFNVQKFTHEKHGDISPFGDTTCAYHFWLRQPTDDGIINALSIEANKPYIISMPNSYEYEEEFNHPGLLTFTSTNVTVPVTKVEGVWLGDSAQIVPTFQNIYPSSYIYVLNVGEPILNHPEGSIFISDYRSARPFEVYTFHEHSNGARYISLSSLFGGEGTTGIVDVMKTAELNGETWYDMNGRRLQSKPVRKGVYIKNGKKVVVK